MTARIRSCTLELDDITSIVLCTEYVLLFLVVAFSLSNLTLGNNNKRTPEIVVYHASCIFTCTLRSIVFLHKMLLSSDSKAFVVIMLLAPLPFITAISALVSTWAQKYLNMCAYQDEMLQSFNKIKFWMLVAVNGTVYASACILIAVVTALDLQCKRVYRHCGSCLERMREFCYQYMPCYCRCNTA